MRGGPVATLLLHPAGAGRDGKAELSGSLSTWASRRRLFPDLRAGLVWARERAEAVAVYVDGTWWTSGPVPSLGAPTRLLDADAEAGLAERIDEEFRRSVAERKRYDRPVAWYLAFELPPQLGLERAEGALRACDGVLDLTVRGYEGQRPYLFVHVEGYSRDNVLRTKHDLVSDALRSVSPPIRMPGIENALVDISVIGNHQIGLVEFQHLSTMF